MKVSRSAILVGSLVVSVLALVTAGLVFVRLGAQAGPSPEELRALGLRRWPPVSLPLDVSSGDQSRSAKRVELGRLLFFDRRMSGNGTMSCASCHVPERGWGDGLALSAGYPGSQHWRNTQTVINSSQLLKLF